MIEKHDYLKNISANGRTVKFYLYIIKYTIYDTHVDIKLIN